MHARFLSVAVFVAFFALVPGARAQTGYKQLPVTNEAYVKPFVPLRIVGNLYYRVLIANMASINPGVTVGGMPGFPGITDAYLQTLAKQKQLKPDVWVASHAAQFNLHQKFKPGDPYDPNRFVDPEGYQAKIRSYEKLVQANLQKEAKDQ